MAEGESASAASKGLVRAEIGGTFPLRGTDSFGSRGLKKSTQTGVSVLPKAKRRSGERRSRARGVLLPSDYYTLAAMACKGKKVSA